MPKQTQPAKPPKSGRRAKRNAALPDLQVVTMENGDVMFLSRPSVRSAAKKKAAAAYASQIEKEKKRKGSLLAAISG